MKTALPENLLAVCEDLGWTVREYDSGTAELSQYSPAGEDFSFAVRCACIAEDVRDYYEDFDSEEHAAMWYGGPGAPNLHTLLEDAEDLEEMLEDLAVSLEQAN